MPGESSERFVGALVSVDWSEIKSTAWLVLGFLVMAAVIGCLTRLKLIYQIIKEFNNARGPIWDLRKTITDLMELEPVIRQLAGQMALLDAKVDAARRQVAELQVESISGRTQDGDGPATCDRQADAVSVEQTEKNWELLRDGSPRFRYERVG